MASAEKTCPAEQRALKKAVRRAAFIQEVAEAVAIRFGQAVHKIHIAGGDTLHLGGLLAEGLGRAAYGMPAREVNTPTSASPFREARAQQEAVKDREKRLEMRSRVASALKDADLRWAIKEGYLPAAATELPSEEVQRYLLTLRGVGAAGD